LLGGDDEGLDVADESLVDAGQPLVERVVLPVGVAEQQLGGGPVDVEELECRLQGGAKWGLRVSEACWPTR
jgi:hypothetical protein